MVTSFVLIFIIDTNSHNMYKTSHSEWEYVYDCLQVTKCLRSIEEAMVVFRELLSVLRERSRVLIGLWSLWISGLTDPAGC